MAKADAGMFKAWEAMHQQWWNAVTEGAGQAMSGDWRDGAKALGDWFGGKLGDGTDAATDRFVSGAKQYLDWVEQMSAQIVRGGAFPTDAAGWTRLFQDAVGPMAAHQNPLRRLFDAVVGDGAKGVEQWLSGWPNPADWAKQEAQGVLGLPTFGYTREQQARQQRLVADWLAYQDALAAYNRLMLDASQKAFKKFEALLAARERDQKPLDSLRAVYDLWVDAAEDAYAEVSLSAAFRTAYGDLVNRQMQVRKGIQTEVERFTAQFGMPTRTEVDSSARRVQELRRDIRALHERIEALEAAAAPQPKAKASSARKPRASAAASTPKPSRRTR